MSAGTSRLGDTLPGWIAFLSNKLVVVSLMVTKSGALCLSLCLPSLQHGSAHFGPIGAATFFKTLPNPFPAYAVRAILLCLRQCWQGVATCAGSSWALPVSEAEAIMADMC